LPVVSDKETKELIVSSPRANLAGRYAAPATWLSVGVSALSLFLIVRQLPVQAGVERMEGWLDQLGFLAPVAFGLIYVVAVVALAPASLLTLAAGAIFGLVRATVLVSLASTAGAACAFLIARYLARGRIERHLRQYPRFQPVDRAISRGGWRIVALLRLSPAVPFNLQNYFYGLTGIRFWPCILTSWLAMLPGTFLYVYLGYVGRRGLETTREGETASGFRWTLTIAGLAATLGVVYYVARLARKALKEQTTFPVDETPSEKRWSWSTTVAVVLAATLLALAIYLQVRQEVLGNQP
jgi:uncharacterized membrane protein YdjX (TVP38/TMEM64 family)